MENNAPNPMTNSFTNKNTLSKSSLNIMETMTTEKNFESNNNANHYIGNTYTLIDSEFLKKSMGENLNKLKSKYFEKNSKL